MPDPTLPAFDRASIAPSTNASTQTHKDFGRALVPGRLLSIIWRILIIVAAVTGIVLNSKTINGFANKFVYFTIQSNIMLIVYCAYAIWATVRKSAGPAPFLKGAVIVYITITALVYNIILARLVGPSSEGILVPLIGGTLDNDLLHIIAPIMAMLDWLLFDVHGRFHWRYALQWLIYPLLYLVFILIRGVLVSGPFVYPYVHYPYGFLDVEHIGYGGVAVNTVIYGVVFWLIGFVYVALDRMLARFNRR